MLSNAEQWRTFSFCKLEPYLPDWYVLNLGMNQLFLNIFDVKLYDIPRHKSAEMKYFIKDKRSFGAFGIAFSYKMYAVLIDKYDFNASDPINVKLYPLDKYYRFIEHNDEIRDKCFTIHPTLIIPDVRHSTLRGAREQNAFLKQRTTHNMTYFSKYWKLRFNDNFKQLTLDSPSKTYLRQNR
eukprot:763374_1